MNLSKFVYGALFTASLALLLSGWSLGFSGSKAFLSADEVTLSTVQTGEFSQRVSGYGTLQSENQRLITASSAAVVDRLLIKPGGRVSADNVLMTLQNPALESALEQTLAELENLKLSRRKLALEQQREMLAQESSLLELKSATEIAELQMQARAPLVKTGVVSKVEYRSSQVTYQRLNERLQLEINKLGKLQEVHSEYLQIQEEEIKQAQAKFDRARANLEKLRIKAGIEGVVQRLPVKLGQSVSVGDELALVGSLSPLIAQVKVPQLKASLVQVGASAEIDTRHGLVKGQVMRVDPVVEKGAVMVEIQLTGALNKNIRPMQLVDAVIFGESRADVNFVDKPSAVDSDSSAAVFKMIDDYQAQRVQVQFGTGTDNVIEIRSGLKVGDSIITSALSVAEDTQIIQLQ